MSNDLLLVDPLLFDEEDYDEYILALIEEQEERRELIERKYRQ